jgi:hypothetical protein
MEERKEAEVEDNSTPRVLLNFEEIEDVGKRHGSSKIKMQKSAKKKFNEFLQATNFVYKNIDEIPEEIWERNHEILGKYSSYLTKHCESIKKWKTHDNYVSQIHSLLKEKYPVIICGKTWDNYYTSLRANIKKQFHHECSDSGIPMTENAALAKLPDIIYIATKLLCEKTNFAEAETFRSMVVLGTVGCGRVTEVNIYYC